MRYSIDIIADSVCNLSAVREATSKADLIFHLATQCLVKGNEDPVLIHAVNDLGTYNVCLVAKEKHCKIVYIGSSEEYGTQEKVPIKENAPLNPTSLYGLTKVIGERYVKFFHRIYKVPAVIIRPFNTFGPRQREDAYAGVITSFVKRLESGHAPLIFGDGYQRRDFSYVTDIVDGIMLLSKLEDCQIVNLGMGVDVTIRDLAEKICEAWGCYVYPLFDAPRVNDVRQLCADTELAKSHGYKPKVKLEEGLKKYVEWYKSCRNRQ